MDPFPGYRHLVCALFLAGALLGVFATDALATGAMPEAIASYRITVRYDPATHEVRGRAAVTWVNTSGETVPDLQLHLYLNAFKNMKSTFMRETVDDVPRIAARLHPHWGWIDITRLTLDGGADLTQQIEFIAPDDGNADDQTVARVRLPRPLAPGEALRFTVEFHERFPRVVDRSGWAKDFVFAAQWFPKLGVYEPAGRNGRARGGWNCHQFHNPGEFFADFGDYDVRITVPKGWKVGATGERADRHENVDGTITERFTQRGVHDFAWTASPRFEIHQREFVASREVRPSELAAVAWELDRVVDDVRLPDINVTLLAFPGERRAVERHFKAVFAAIKYYGLWYGPYPYDQLTILVPPHDAVESGGMEYPTLFQGWPSFLSPAPFGDVENTTVHEYGHQYWYGLVASNEFEESWLDEGFNSYSTARIMDRVYPPALASWRWAGYRLPGVEWHALELPWAPFHLEAPEGWGKLAVPLFGVFGTPSRTSELGARRRRYLANPATDDVVRKAWEYRSDNYGVNSYSRPATLLATLERLIGSPAWPRVMRTYAENFRFKHPTTRDFLRTLNTVTQQDWSWFFDQFVWGHRRVDYAVASVTSDEIAERPGVYDQDGRRVTVDARSVERARRELEKKRQRIEKTGEKIPTMYRSEVIVERRGDGVLPVELMVYFSDSTAVREHWDGRYQWTRFRYTRAAQVDSAVVDLQEKVLLDTDRLNNSRTRKANHLPAQRWTARWLLWVQSFIQLVGWLA